eukprot:g14033.t1
MNVNPSERRGTVFSAFTLCDDLGKGLGPSIVVALVSIFGRRKAFTMAFAAWWISGAIVTQLRHSLYADASRGDSILPTKKILCNALHLSQSLCPIQEQPPELPSGTADDISRAVHGLLQKDTRKRMSLDDALSTSSAIAALAAPSFAEAQTKGRYEREQNPFELRRGNKANPHFIQRTAFVALMTSKFSAVMLTAGTAQSL